MIKTDLEITLAQLVAIPSVSNNYEECKKVIEYVTNALKPFDLFIHHSQDNANPWMIATTQNTKTPDILLAAHLDVVPAPDELFTMQHVEGKLIGRGVYDMKLAAACYLELFRRHSTALKNKNIGIMFTTDEEIGGACIPQIINDGWRPGVIFIPDGGDNWHIEERAKGMYAVEITAHGKAAHGSRPWEGDNALHNLMDALHELRQAFPVGAKSDATLMVNQIQAGQAINQLPDEASAKLDFRSFHNTDMQTLKAILERFITERGFAVNELLSGSPLAFNKNHPAVQSFLTVMQEKKGTLAYTESYGASDARYFAPLDIPCIIVEPKGGGRHAEDEWLDAEDFARYYELIEHWILHT